MQNLLEPLETSTRGLPRRRNGGFPEPQPGEPFETVDSVHPGCGAETSVMVPRTVGCEVVRRVVCSGCGRRYRRDPGFGTDVLAPAPAATSDEPLRKILGVRMPLAESRPVRLGAILLAGAAVLGGLYALQGSGGSVRPVHPATPPEASFLKRPTFSLAVPSGWHQAKPGSGAALRLVAPGAAADATLWVERNPSLSFADFERRSLRNLRTLSGDARVYQRLGAPGGGGTIVQLRADVRAGGGTSPYLVTLRAAGPYRYYLATSVKANAAPATRKGAALVHGSFVPEGTP